MEQMEFCFVFNDRQMPNKDIVQQFPRKWDCSGANRGIPLFPGIIREARSVQVTRRRKKEIIFVCGGNWTGREIWLVGKYR